jgi:hypothetical protein
MDSDEWLAIIHVADWLRVFRSATTQMSATQRSSVLSTTHAIFRGLQEHVLNIFRSLPADTPQIISNSLLDAYRKLSDYYYKFDESPFYCWAACKLYYDCSYDDNGANLFQCSIHVYHTRGWRRTMPRIQILCSISRTPLGTFATTTLSITASTGLRGASRKKRLWLTWVHLHLQIHPLRG